MAEIRTPDIWVIRPTLYQVCHDALHDIFKMEIKMVHCTKCCNLILTRGRSHVTLGVTVLTGCSSGTLPKILPMGTASLPSNSSFLEASYFSRLLRHAVDAVVLFSGRRHHRGYI